MSDKKTIHLIVVLERNIDSYAAGDLLQKKIKGSKTVLFRKSVGFYKFVTNLINEYKDNKITLECVAFVPSLKSVQSIKDDLSEYVEDINVYVNEDVTGVITEHLNVVKNYPMDMSIVSYMCLENNSNTTPIVNLLDILSTERTNIGKLVLKLTPFSYYDNFIEDRSQESIDKVSYASKVLSNYISIQSRVNVENITFHILDEISIPFVNTIHQVKHKVLEQLMHTMDNEYPIVGTYQVINRDTVAVSLMFNGKGGGKTAREVAECFGGSGSVFKAGCYIDFKDFFQ